MTARRRRTKTDLGWARPVQAVPKLTLVVGVGRHGSRDYCSRCGQKLTTCMCERTAA